MTSQLTNREIQRGAFVESLHTSLKTQASKAVDEHMRFINVASSYMADGLACSECIELLMIDGLSRIAAEGYTSMVLNKEASSNTLPEYSFQFEDIYGKVWTSFDIGKTVNASNDREAWMIAEELVDKVSQIESQKVLSVNRMS